MYNERLPALRVKTGQHQHRICKRFSYSGRRRGRRATRYEFTVFPDARTVFAAYVSSGAKRGHVYDSKGALYGVSPTKVRRLSGVCEVFWIVIVIESLDKQDID